MLSGKSIDKQRWMPIIHGDIIDYIHNIAIDYDLCEKLSIGCTCHIDLKQLELCT